MAFLELGAHPNSLAERETDFTPVDLASQAMMAITRYFSQEHVVFHIENNLISLRKTLLYVSGLGYQVMFVDWISFAKATPHKESGGAENMI